MRPAFYLIATNYLLVSLEDMNKVKWISIIGSVMICALAYFYIFGSMSTVSRYSFPDQDLIGIEKIIHEHLSDRKRVEYQIDRNDESGCLKLQIRTHWVDYDTLLSNLDTKIRLKVLEEQVGRVHANQLLFHMQIYKTLGLDELHDEVEGQWIEYLHRGNRGF